MTGVRRIPSGAPIPAGVGLFTGKHASVRIERAAPGTGMQFRRTDLPGKPTIAATIANLSRRAVHPAFARLPARCTSLELPDSDRIGVATVEHILSALVGLGITDALIDVEGEEIPIGDGSAALIVEAILASDITNHLAPVEPIIVNRPISVSDSSGARIDAEPSDRPRYTYHLDYGPASPITPQSASWAGDADDYATNIAPARTFCLEEEARAMQALGLFKALTPRDMLVFGVRGPIDNTLRFPNEPARHKLLDLIGDLALAGRPIQGRITATRSGHALNHEMALLLAGL